MAEINFNQSSLSNISKNILNASTQDEVNLIRKNIQPFIKETKIFNQEYKKMIEQIQQYEQNLQILIRSWHKTKADLMDIGINYKDTKEYSRYSQERKKIKQRFLNQKIISHVLTTYEMAMSFQTKINAILGQSITTAYIWVNKKTGVPETYLISDMSDFLKLDVDKTGKIVSRYKNNVKLLRQHTNKLESSVQETDDFDYNKLLNTYKNKVKKRYDKYKIPSKGSYILWLNPDIGQKWHGAYISSFGSINEAYASLLLHQKFNPRNISQDDMEQFMNEVLGVTNLSGTLEGDITVGNAQIAVKSAAATTLSIQQLYEISQNIINQKLDNFNSLYNYLSNVKKINKEKEQRINVDLKDALQQVINESIEQAINNIKNKN